MEIVELSALIPANYRKEILELNMIAKASSNRSDATMKYLFEVWKEFIEPNNDLNFECGNCLERILTNFRGMQESMIQLEKNHNLLNAT